MPATPGTELYLKEVFSSLQGEGVFIGRRQLFVRLAQCNLACAYCDTDYAVTALWHAEEEPGGARGEDYPNPAAPAFLTALVARCLKQLPAHHSLALTGGEPLVQSQALAEWLPDLSQCLPVYLETNGTLPDAMERLLPFVSWVSLDIKLSGTTGVPTPWEAHAAFLEVSRSKACQAKIVIDASTTEEELVAAARLLRQHGPDLPLILQPRTVAGRPAFVGRQLLRLQALVASEHPATLVIPQMHPLLDIR